MATNTPNYNLVKQDPSEFYNRELDNENLDKIDTAIKEAKDAVENIDLSQIEQEISAVDTKVNEHLDDLASQQADKGASLIGVNDSAGLFTATNVEGALKEAIEKANSAFTSASNGKQLVGNAITGVDDSVVIPTEPSYQDLATAIGSISTGKKWASGEIVSVNGRVEVTGLGFRPSLVVVKEKSNTDERQSLAVYVDLVKHGALSDISVYASPTGSYYKELNHTMSDTGFTLRTAHSGINYVWLAYE